jgi:hypothetical protein
MNLRRIGVGIALVLNLVVLAACDRSPIQAAPARKPATTRGSGQPRQLVMTTRPVGKSATQPSYDAVDLKAPPEIVAEIVNRVGFDPFRETAVQLHNLGGRPKLTIVGPTKLHDGEYSIDVEEMGQARTSTQREFSGWINLKSRDVPEECRTFIQAKWAQEATTTPTTAPLRMDSPITVTVLWVGPKMTDKSTSRIGMKHVPPVTPDGGTVTPDRTRPPASNAAPSPST